MNIDLSKAAAKQKSKQEDKKKLLYGLNTRKEEGGKKRSIKSAFGDDDDDNDDDEPQDVASENSTTRKKVMNRALAKEQAAVRQATTTMQDPALSSLYDYDGAYESFHPTASQDKGSSKETEEKKSRYLGDLVQAAKRRKHERDLIYDRKMAREQEAEEAAAGGGKLPTEKYVTAAYKRQLQERALWLQEEEKQQRVEEANDVTQMTGQTAMARFYGNLNRNVAMGGGASSADPKDEDDKKKAMTGKEEKKPSGDKTAAASASLPFDFSEDEFVKASSSHDPELQSGTDDTGRREGEGNKQELRGNDKRDHKEKEADESDEDPVTRQKRRRKQRDEKVAQARIRYWERQEQSQTVVQQQ